MNKDRSETSSSSVSRPRSVSITGTGLYLPERVLTNAELEKMVDTSDEWIFARTGMKERRIAREDETSSEMGAAAAEVALKDAGIGPGEVDMIVVATCTPDTVFPSTAALIQDRIGARKAFGMDVSAACSGFLYGLDIATQFVAAGRIETALLVGVEKMSSITDWTDRTTCVLFGDAAGAAVLQARGAPRGILTTDLYSDGALGDLLIIPGGGSRNPTSEETAREGMHYLKMKGREVFKHAVTNMADAAKHALKKAGLTIDDIDCIIPHQANTRIIKAIADRVGAPMEKFFLNVESYGNTSAASVGVALDEASKSGRVRKGDMILIVVFGGGFTWGASILQWDKE